MLANKSHVKRCPHIISSIIDIIAYTSKSFLKHVFDFFSKFSSDMLPFTINMLRVQTLCLLLLLNEAQRHLRDKKVSLLLLQAMRLVCLSLALPQA
eukprot:UN15958